MSAESTRARRGVILMLAAVGVFALMDALLKDLSGRYPALQVTGLRGLASLPFLLLPLIWRRRLAQLRPVRWHLHLLRGALGVVMLWTFVLAVRQQPLTMVYSIYMLAPLLIVALAALLLRERVDAVHWIAIAIGLAGVIVILRPDVDGVVSLGALAALVSTASYAFAVLLVRRMVRTETSDAIAFWFLAIIGTVCMLLAIPLWRPILSGDWAVIALVGLLGAIAQLLITEAFRHAPAATVAPYEYTALLWGAALDWLVWRSLPGAHVFGGAALIAGAGLAVWHRTKAA
ncbi:MAG: DMT family transporter [Steroidobacteraceae bacterium]|nr:DMT family transporter [Steroidobacteraceae bacterium]MDW8259409.1 DMT family transporter [Gammaproteobacteria bacterium]